VSIRGKLGKRAVVETTTSKGCLHYKKIIQSTIGLVSVLDYLINRSFRLTQVVYLRTSQQNIGSEIGKVECDE
jgi:hypothetical protein